jgi:hypothetical protein
MEMFKVDSVGLKDQGAILTRIVQVRAAVIRETEARRH